jgi:hypothetical protein
MPSSSIEKTTSGSVALGVEGGEHRADLLVLVYSSAAKQWAERHAVGFGQLFGRRDGLGVHPEDRRRVDRFGASAPAHSSTVRSVRSTNLVGVGEL